MTYGPIFKDNSWPEDIPEDAYPTGESALDNVIFDVIYKHWRAGKQIVLLVGSGISAQSGFPTLGPLGKHLLTLDSFRESKLRLPNLSKENNDKFSATAYSLDRDGWISPNLFPEFFSKTPVQVIRDMFGQKIKDSKVFSEDFETEIKKKLENASIDKLSDFAREFMGANWFGTLNKIAGGDPQQTDALFDAIGMRVHAGPAHNLLAQFISWFNVQLVLTTNFDSLIESSIKAEYRDPYVFDVHVQAPPPSAKLVKQHLSVIKLHGTHFGIRADNTINTPLDKGHLSTFMDYFEADSLILVMGYGGADRRVMNILETYLETNKTGHKIVRVDDLNLDKWNGFAGIHKKFGNDLKKGPFWNLYYPHSRFFLLDVFQKCSGKMPSTRTSYSSVPHTPSPFKEEDRLGYTTESSFIKNKTSKFKNKRGLSPLWPDPPEDTSDSLTPVEGLIPTIYKSVLKDDAPRFAVVSGGPGSGVSQVLSQIAELSFRTHQSVWCDLDEAASVGTLVSWIYNFVLTRQPDLPQVPLPLDLPVFEDKENELGFKSLKRVVGVLWDRLKRDRYLVIIDSISYAIVELIKEDNDRVKREAARLVLFMSLLLQCAHDGHDGQGASFVLVGSNHLNNTDPKTVADVHDFLVKMSSYSDVHFDEMKGFINLMFSKNSSSGPLPLVDLDADDKLKINRCRHNIESSTSTLYGHSSSKVEREEIIAALRKAVQGDRSEYNKYIFDPSRDVPYGQCVEPRTFFKFLIECAFCNRPRSWTQILSLPSVNDSKYAGKIKVALQRAKDKPTSSHSNDEIIPDVTTCCARILLNIAVGCGLLRQQQGGFYYMDISLRTSLRNEYSISPKASGIADTAQILFNRSDFVILNNKMFRYYERVFNLSGDITSLNYCFWHSYRLLSKYKMVTFANLTKILHDVREVTRVLLENTDQARGHLSIYDHAFLLLRLRDFLCLKIDDINLMKENQEQNLATHNEQETTKRKIGILKHSIEDLRLLGERVDITLFDLYEESEDVTSGSTLLDQLKTFISEEETKPKPENVEWHQKQKLFTRSLDIYRACAAGMLAICPPKWAVIEQYGIPVEALKEVIASHSLDKRDKKAIKDAVLRLFQVFSYTLDAAFGPGRRLSREEVKKRRKDWMSAIAEEKWDAKIVIKSIVRLVKNIVRLSVHEKLPKDLTDMMQEEITLLSGAKELLAVLSTHLGDDISLKKLWSHLHSTNAMASVLMIDKAKYDLYSLSKVYYSLSLARSYSLRVSDSQSSIDEAVSDLYEMEALIWEARMIMGGKDNSRFDEAKARQESAVRKGEEALARLTDCRLAIVRWRDLAILSAVSQLEIVKRITNNHKDSIRRVGIWDFSSSPPSLNNDVKRTLQALEEVSFTLQEASIKMHFMMPVIWNDPWREARMVFQVLRLIYNAWAWLALSIRLSEYFNRNLLTDVNLLSSLTVSTNRIIRALRFVSPVPVDIETLEDTKDYASAEWVDRLHNKVCDMWNDTQSNFGALNVNLISESQTFSGFQDGVESLQQHVGAVNKSVVVGSLLDFDITYWLGKMSEYNDGYKLGIF